MILSNAGMRTVVGPTSPGVERLERNDAGKGAGGPWRGNDSLRGDMPEIRLPVFEGPVDLLLHLIERQDLDITAVSLVAVTDQYLAAVHADDTLDARALAEFIAIGAKLIHLKSRALLPALHDDETIEDDDVGRELVELLGEYRRFSAVADMLEDRQRDGLRLYPRNAPPPPVPRGSGIENLKVDALYAVMLEVLERIPEPPRASVQRNTFTLSEQVDRLRHRLLTRGRFSFRAIIRECETRIEVVITFMAVLELLKGGACDAQQDERWGDINVVAVSRAAAG